MAQRKLAQNRMTDRELPNEHFKFPEKIIEKNSVKEFPLYLPCLGRVSKV